MTIFDAVLRRGPAQTFPKDPTAVTSAEFVTNAVVIGEHIASQDDALFDGANLTLTGLDIWCDMTGFDGRHTTATPGQPASGSVAVTFEERATPFYKLGKGKTLRFLSQYLGPWQFAKRKEVTLKERNTIELLYPDKLSIRQLIREMHIWQSFFFFALRRPSYTDEFYLLRSSGGARVALILPGRKALSADRRAIRDAVFRQSTLGDQIGNRLRGWREQYDCIELAILIFSGTAYQESVYVHTTLLSYLQALEVLHRETYAKDRFPDAKTRRDTIAALRNAIPKSLDADLQKELKEGISFLGSVRLLDRLKHLLSLYPNSAGPLFPRGDADMVMLKNARNFLTHYGDQKKASGRTSCGRVRYSPLKRRRVFFLRLAFLGQ